PLNPDRLGWIQCRLPRLHEIVPIGLDGRDALVYRRWGQTLNRLHMADPVVKVPGCHLIGIKRLSAPSFVPFDQNPDGLLVFLNGSFAFSLFLKPVRARLQMIHLDLPPIQQQGGDLRQPPGQKLPSRCFSNVPYQNGRLSASEIRSSSAKGSAAATSFLVLMYSC